MNYLLLIEVVEDSDQQENNMAIFKNSADILDLLLDLYLQGAELNKAKEGCKVDDAPIKEPEPESEPKQEDPAEPICVPPTDKEFVEKEDALGYSLLPHTDCKSLCRNDIIKGGDGYYTLHHYCSNIPINNTTAIWFETEYNGIRYPGLHPSQLVRILMMEFEGIPDIVEDLQKLLDKLEKE